MIRVLHSVGRMNRDGIQTLLMNIYRNIDRNKIQFDFLVSSNIKGDYDDEIIKLGGNIYNISSRRKGYFKNIRESISFFRNHKYDIIHVHISSLTSIQILKAATKQSVKIRIIHCHSIKGPKGVFHYIMHKYNKLYINKYITDKFACSKESAIWAYGKNSLNKGEVNIYNNAINSNDFIFNSLIRDQVRNELLTGDKFVIGHVGRFTEQKNHKFLIDIFKEIIFLKNNSVLLLIGTGKLESKIREKIISYGLEASVIFLGSRSDVNRLIQAMDVFVFPSLNEGFGIAALEAQASGLHVFASKGVPEEASVTDLFHSLDLNLSPIIWAKEILKYSVIPTRVNKSSEIKNKGYDINVNAKWLMNYYINKLETMC